MALCRGASSCSSVGSINLSTAKAELLLLLTKYGLFYFFAIDDGLSSVESILAFLDLSLDPDLLLGIDFVFYGAIFKYGLS